MGVAKTLSLAGFLIMVGMTAYGIVSGNIGGEGSVLLSLAWGRVLMADAITGLLVFSGFIIFRERWGLRALVWIALLLALGNLVACLYVFLALQNARNDWRLFWFGSRIKLEG